MLHHRSLKVLLALTVLVTPLFTNSALRAQATTSASPDSVINWNGIAQNAAVLVAHQFPAQSLIYISFEQAAVYDAVVAIEGQYQPYKLHLKPRPNASVDAAVAAAAHDVLVHYFPAQQADLDLDYATSLAAITDGTPKTAGIQLGQQAAAGIIALRQGDGLEANIGFTMPPPGPGVWQLPPGVLPQTPWVSRLRPFFLDSPNQFRPGPPPALASKAWATEFNETKLLGSSTSTVRTADQKDAALFWTASGGIQDNVTYAQVILDHGFDAVQAARLFAMGDMIEADALIGCFDAKYHYLFWRPQFAIPAGDTDGNPATVADPTWTPLLGTPNHPEYPSGHGCGTGAQAEVLAAVLGTDQINVNITSSAPGVIQTTRHFNTVDDLVQEIVDVRVWGGIHWRGSDLAGVALGRGVARWALDRYFQPTLGD